MKSESRARKSFFVLRKSSVVDVILVCIFKMFLDGIFVWFVLPLYSYETEIAQTVSGNPNGAKIAISYAIVSISTLLYRSIGALKSASRFVMLVQLVIIVVPFATLYGFLNYPTWQMFLVFLGYGSTILFIGVLPVKRLPLLNAEMGILFVMIMAAIVAYVYAALMATGGIHRMNFNLLKVYDVREDLSENKFPLSGYVIPWVAYVLNMAALTHFMSLRKVSLIKSIAGVSAVMVMQLLLFGMTNFKAFLFLPFVIVFLMLFLGKINLLRSALLGSSGALLCLIAVSVTGIPFGAAIVNRVFVMPPAIHALYFNYFSTHPPGLLQGTVGKLFGSTYDQTIIDVISNYYFSKTFSENVGWIGDAFGNFGFAGVLVYAFILALVLRFADGFVDKRMPDGVIEGLLFGFAFGITNSALLTSLFTGGYVVAMLALWIIASRWKRDFNGRNLIAETDA